MITHDTLSLEGIVSAIASIITLVYIWKTRIIGADRELTAKYKDGYEEYKEKYKEAVKEINGKDLQLDMMRTRLAEAEGRLKVYENQPYRPNGYSLMEKPNDQTI